MMRKIALFLFALLSPLLFSVSLAHAQVNFEEGSEGTVNYCGTAGAYPHCQGIDGDVACCQEDCGAIMCGISKGCFNQGDCELSDMLQVGVNIGNFALVLVGSVVLLMYIVGGGYMVLGGANPALYAKGKTMLKTATIGLVITLVAGMLIRTLNATLRAGGQIQKMTCESLSTPQKVYSCVDRNTGSYNDCAGTGYCPNQPDNIVCCAVSGTNTAP